jgi:hypothetical protein
MHARRTDVKLVPLSQRPKRQLWNGTVLPCWEKATPQSSSLHGEMRMFKLLDIREDIMLKHFGGWTT